MLCLLPCRAVRAVLCRQKSVKALERAAATGEKRKEKGKRKPTGAPSLHPSCPRPACAEFPIPRWASVGLSPCPRCAPAARPSAWEGSPRPGLAPPHPLPAPLWHHPRHPLLSSSPALSCFLPCPRPSGITLDIPSSPPHLPFLSCFSSPARSFQPVCDFPPPLPFLSCFLPPRPAAFNLFVKEKLEEFKQRGVKDPKDTGTNNGLFK